MARRAPAEDDDVSLFPFLSIIAAVIGVLTLMVAAVTLGQMNQEDVKEVVANAIELEQLNEKLAEAEKEVETLMLTLGAEEAERLKNSKARQEELVKTRAELEALLKRLEEAQRKTDELKEVEIIIPEVPEGQRESIDDIQAQLAEVKERLAMLRRDLSDRKKPPEEAEVSILPGGTGISFEPNFVECTANAIVLHTEDPPRTIRLAEIAANPQFRQLLQKVANDDRQTIVFVLRSDSLGTYSMVKTICERAQVRYGKLPAVGNGRLDFSHFRKD
ncbi:MAG: hypothetical protein GTO53_12905 [Planctomycetales bacterium]|nr:hypothetical protein [Planctomycetales bacterium]NIM09999.1 hypothetical protein [Planctomycetales bacterium]NIN09439.1 hypothetical protein [Planctomycetales bacterium]NIN78548.1 hypothetical protein [Planctomycetales bacterium]NIO35740.1 hypothetical protein [Planctomycetales bacterium]